MQTKRIRSKGAGHKETEEGTIPGIWLQCKRGMQEGTMQCRMVLKPVYTQEPASRV